MARIRTVKPEFWTSEQVMELSPLARLLFIGLWNFCDDRGVHPASVKTLKAEVFPADDITADQISGLVAEMIAQRLLSEFDAQGRRWWHVTGWHHQMINRPSTSKYPPPPAGNGGDSLSTHGGLTEPSLSTHGGLTAGREWKGREINPPNPPLGGFPVDNSTEEAPAARRKVNGKSQRLNLATDRAVAKAWREHLGKDPPTGKSLEECRALFWQQYRGAH